MSRSEQSAASDVHDHVHVAQQELLLIIEVERLEEIQHDRPDLMLLDLMMPEVSGEDVIKACREDNNLKDLTIVVLTARASQEDRLGVIELGADEYLAKPIISKEILIRIRNMTARIDLNNEKLKQAIIESQMEAAKSIQEAQLNVQTDIEGIEIHSHYQASEKTGGDWFGDFYCPQSNQLFLLIGDVTGHGIPAALITGAAAGAAGETFERITQQKATDIRENVLQFATSINNAIHYAGAKTGKRMTMAIVGIDLNTGKSSYLNAGHYPIFVKSQQKVKIMVGPSQMMGDPHENFYTEEFQLEANGTICLFTDGIEENINQQGQKMSIGKISRIIDTANDPNELNSLLKKKIDTFASSQRSDDTAFLLVTWSPQPMAIDKAS